MSPHLADFFDRLDQHGLSMDEVCRLGEISDVLTAAARWRRAGEAMAAELTDETVAEWCDAVTELERAVDALTDRPGRLSPQIAPEG
jgi:hypothetical protein